MFFMKRDSFSPYFHSRVQRWDGALILNSTNVIRLMLQKFIGYDRKSNDKGYVDSTIMSIGRPDAWVAAVAFSFV